MSQLHTILPNPFVQASKLDRFGDVSRLILVQQQQQQQEFIELKEIKVVYILRVAVIGSPFLIRFFISSS